MSRRRDRCLHVMSSMGHCFKRTYSICILLLCRNCPFKLSISSRFKRCIKINMFCSIMMHQRTAVHFSLTQRRNNTQSRGDLWVSSLMYSKVATKLKSREVANYVSSVTTMNQLKKCWVSYLRRFSPIVRHHICCLDLVYWLQRKASLKHVHKHILMNFRNNLHTFPLAEFCRYISTSKGWICPEVNI